MARDMIVQRAQAKLRYILFTATGQLTKKTRVFQRHPEEQTPCLSKRIGKVYFPNREISLALFCIILEALLFHFWKRCQSIIGYPKGIVWEYVHSRLNGMPLLQRIREWPRPDEGSALETSTF